jgi:cytochrome c biogenesis protein CcdA
VLRLIGIAISIGLADSINPSTIAPALYLAAGERPRQSVTKFTFGVFAVYLLGGLLIAAGPGQLLIALTHRPSTLVRQLLEVLAGVVMLTIAALSWRHRKHLARIDPAPSPEGRSSALLGAGITAVELPTAFPYFGVIFAVIGSRLDFVRQVLVLVLFNVCFVLPLLGAIATLWIFGDRAAPKLARARDFLQRYWPVLLSGLALIAGALAITLGATGIAARVHGRLGRFFRHFHKIIPH